MILIYFLLPGTVINITNSLARYSANLQRYEIKSGSHNWVYLDGGSGEAIVFIHGFGLNKDLWGQMLPAFSKKYRVIAPDLPSFGETMPVNGEIYTISNQANLLDQFIRLLNLKSFHLVGVSAGGAISAYYATLYPDKIKSLAIIGPFGVQTAMKSDFRKAYDKGENPLVFKTPEGYDVMLTYGVNKSQTIPAHLKSYLAGESAKRYDMYIDQFKIEIDTEGWDMLRMHLKKIKAPTLVIFGDKDRIFDVSCIDVFKKEIKNVQTLVVKDAGHLAYLDKPDETINPIKDFIILNGKN